MSALDVPEAEILPWYRAYRRFAAILREPAGELRLRLSPGDLLIMENNRALHGRTAFDPNLGRRHLQGCYVDKDGVESRRRVLERAWHERSAQRDLAEEIVALYRRKGEMSYGEGSP
jgi:Probable taurine catabolism dioxygenase